MKARGYVLLALGIVLIACAEQNEQVEAEAPVRGLITKVVSEFEDSTIRRYPGVLEPGEVNALAFEVGGRLDRINLDVGERVAKGQLLAFLDAEQFQTEIENKQAAVEEAVATLEQSEADLERSQILLDRQVGTLVRRDEDRTSVRQNKAQLTQAQKDLAGAEQDLADSKLFSPFDGIVDSLAVESFATVSSGQTVLSIYEQTDYEVAFSVSFDVIGRLVVGTPATIRLSDDPTVVLKGVVSELGERAEQVASFPVVVKLEETVPVIKAGMAVEVSFEFSLSGERGHLIPVSAAIPEGEIQEGAGTNGATELEVFVYDEATSTVKRRRVTMGGIRENQFLIVDGLSVGERVAIRGVTFLREGMEVKLLTDDGET